MKLNKQMIDLTTDILDFGNNKTLLEQSKFPKEVGLRFVQLLEMELGNERNIKEIENSHQREIFAVYSSIIKLMVQFSGQEDSKIEALYTEALKVAKQMREYQENKENEEAKSKIILPTGNFESDTTK